MYQPPAFVVPDPAAALVELLADHAATLVTVAGDEPVVTVLPLLADRTDAGLVLRGHVAAPNPHASVAGGARSIVTVLGPEGYISPAWYPSKADHGRVVPTWDYVVATATGRLSLHREPAWLLDVVTRLTDRHEAGRATRWSVDDPPDGFVERQLRAIVGVELVVERVEAKAKLSQNRSEADRAGVVEGLQPVDPVLSEAVRAVGAPEPPRARR